MIGPSCGDASDIADLERALAEADAIYARHAPPGTLVTSRLVRLMIADGYDRGRAVELDDAYNEGYADGRRAGA
jgi:hypothetical protein